MRFSASCVGMVILLFLSPAHATKVSAKISFSKAYREALDEADHSDSSKGKECYWKLPNAIIPTAQVPVEFGDDVAAVLFKEGDAAPGPDEVVTYKVHAGRMEQNVIVTRPGSSIKFLNVSPYTQELYAPEVSSFKAEPQSTSSFRLIEFPSEGVFAIHSKRYPHFKAYVVVTPGRTLSLKSDGSLAEDLAPGQYTLKVFHNGSWVHKQSFTVEGGRMEPLTVNIKPGKGASGGKDTKGESAEKKAPKADKSDN